MSGAPRIMTLGEILVEIMAVERDQSFAAPGPLVGPFPSGAPAIFIDQVAKVGIAAGIIGAVGNDDFGRMTRDRLAADGVHTDAIRMLDDQTTGTAFVTYHASGERDFIYHITHAACARIDTDAVDAARLTGCALFHVMGSSLFSFHMIHAMHKAVDAVKAHGGRVSFDPNVRKEMLDLPEMRDALHYVLEYTDVLLPSEGELMLLTGADTEQAAVAESLANGVSEIVIKKGAAGARYYDRERRIDMPGYAVEEIDPTGAGDCFGATYVALRDAGLAVEDALCYANAAGACAVGKKGPMEGTATRAELDAFMRRHTVGRPVITEYPL
ncbi:sugar kinase [Salinisphaera sp.]|uniref:sugar kinase n=1 Tax=Salinisphaera sp. TaxID=1914330 RepID=UPI002D76A0ED|nr:sugar kinase [Salinisphaera sp.]HET7312988.1 sugar kinase [Salinisphaera sp.]